MQSASQLPVLYAPVYGTAYIGGVQGHYACIHLCNQVGYRAC